MREYFHRVITEQNKSCIAEIFRFFLSGISVIYGVSVKLILWSYKIGLLRKKILPVVVISVGNVTWGGVGKTPLVEWIVKYLREKKIKTAVLIRGYSLKTKEDSSKPYKSDEAQLLQESLKDVPVLVGRNRFKNAEQFLRTNTADAFVLDDGFQHWGLHRNLDILAIDTTNPWGNGFLIPRGILREPMKSLKRADVFVLTKTERGKENISVIKTKLQSLNPNALVVETIHAAVSLEDLCFCGKRESPSFLAGKRILAFCSIGEPDSFFDLLVSLKVDIVFKIFFWDHYEYQERDILELIGVVQDQKISILVTTEKDAVKLGSFLDLIKLNGQLFSLKIEIQIVKGSKELCGRISHLFSR